MVDYDLFKKFLESEDEGFIKYGDFIDNKTLTLLSNGNQTKVKRLFQKGGNIKDGCSFDCELKCEECGSLFVEKNCSRTRVDKIFGIVSKRQRGYILCPNCSDKWKNKQEEEQRLAREKYENGLQERTESYIDAYLNTNKSWKEGVKTYTKIQELSYKNIDWSYLKDYICDMDYYDFLQTPYWKAIAEKIRYKANYKCQICNSSERLNVHHRSYENHGDELHYMEDLICICKDCHEKHHFE